MRLGQKSNKYSDEKIDQVVFKILKHNYVSLELTFIL